MSEAVSFCQMMPCYRATVTVVDCRGCPEVAHLRKLAAKHFRSAFEVASTALTLSDQAYCSPASNFSCLILPDLVPSGCSRCAGSTSSPTISSMQMANSPQTGFRRIFHSASHQRRGLREADLSNCYIASHADGSIDQKAAVHHSAPFENLAW